MTAAAAVASPPAAASICAAMPVSPGDGMRTWAKRPTSAGEPLERLPGGRHDPPARRRGRLAVRQRDGQPGEVGGERAQRVVERRAVELVGDQPAAALGGAGDEARPCRRSPRSSPGAAVTSAAPSAWPACTAACAIASASVVLPLAGGPTSTTWPAASAAARTGVEPAGQPQAGRLGGDPDRVRGDRPGLGRGRRRRARAAAGCGAAGAGSGSGGFGDGDGRQRGRVPVVDGRRRGRRRGGRRGRGWRRRRGRDGRRLRHRRGGRGRCARRRGLRRRAPRRGADSAAATGAASGGVAAGGSAGAAALDGPAPGPTSSYSNSSPGASAGAAGSGSGCRLRLRLRRGRRGFRGRLRLAVADRPLEPVGVQLRREVLQRRVDRQRQVVAHLPAVVASAARSGWISSRSIRNVV